MVLMYETDAKLENDPSSPLYFFKQKGKVADIKTTVFGGNLAYHGFVSWSLFCRCVSRFLFRCSNFEETIRISHFVL
jgi:hypothetical protein